VLTSINLDLHSGEFFALLGPSGSGKTTLINLIAGFELPDHGDIRIGEQSIIGLPPHRRQVGVVFQNYALFPHLTVQENLAYPLRRRGYKRSDIPARVRNVLELVRMESYADRWIQQLSGGQQQRVAIARALISEPAVLLMDEPMAALDKSLREDLQVELKVLQRKLGTTILYITHDQREAMALADRMAVLNAGRVEQVDVPERLYSAPESSFVARFVSGATIFRGNPIADGGQWWLLTKSGLRLPGKWRKPQSNAPEIAELAIAPGNIRLQSLNEASPNVGWSIEATVESVVFAGESSSIHLVTFNGERLTAREFGKPRFRDGERLLVFWDPAAATLFPQS
jgi:ABC-type Fe3+/spermidine/putrescine transport system ATPase subunit